MDIYTSFKIKSCITIKDSTIVLNLNNTNYEDTIYLIQFTDCQSINNLKYEFINSQNIHCDKKLENKYNFIIFVCTSISQLTVYIIIIIAIILIIIIFIILKQCINCKKDYNIVKKDLIEDTDL